MQVAGRGRGAQGLTHTPQFDHLHLFPKLIEAAVEYDAYMVELQRVATANCRAFSSARLHSQRQSAFNELTAMLGERLGGLARTRPGESGGRGAGRCRARERRGMAGSSLPLCCLDASQVPTSLRDVASRIGGDGL